MESKMDYVVSSPIVKPAEAAKSADPPRKSSNRRTRRKTGSGKIKAQPPVGLPNTSSVPASDVKKEKPREWVQKATGKKANSPDRKIRAPPIKGDEESKDSDCPPAKAKAGAFPAITKHRNPNYPPVTYRIPHADNWTQEKIDKLSRSHPCTLGQYKRTSVYTGHPYCAAVRVIAEAHAVNMAIKTLHESFPDSKLDILDIGGAVRRHTNLKRDYIHSCMPYCDSQDIVRHFQLKGRFCVHTMEECDCYVNNPVGVSISVHSLYYLQPKELMKQLLNKQKVPVHFAVIHDYKGDTGTIMMGEMTYAKVNGRMKVDVHGNYTPYYHGDMKWLESGTYIDNEGAMSWTLDRAFDDTQVLRFTAMRDVSVLRRISPGQEWKVWVEGKEGKQVQENELKDSEFVEAAMKKICDNSFDVHVDMSSQNYTKFLAKVTRKGKAAEFNDIMKLNLYASKYWVNHVSVLAESPEDLAQRASDHRRRLKLEKKEIDWRKVGVAGLIAVMCTLEFWLQGYYSLGFIPLIMWMVVVTQLPDYFESRVSAIAEPATSWDVVLRAIFGKVTGCVDRVRSSSIGDALPLNFIGTLLRARVDDYCCVMPDKPSDPRKLIKFKDSPLQSEECVQKPAAIAMVYSPQHAPYFPRKCCHNTRKSMLNKLVQLLPGAGTYTFGVHPILRSVAERIRNNLEPLDWEEWLSRFPAAKERKLREDRDRNESEPIKVWNDTSFFTKFEAYPEPKYPRPIGASLVETNFSSGRWLIPLAEAFSKSLPENIMFPLHGESIAIGQFFEEWKEEHIYDCDFSSFDSSQTEEALLMIVEFMRMCGVPEKVCQRMSHDIKGIRIRARDGTQMLAKGFRVSGRSETLFGNSLLTINTGLHVFGDSLAAIMAKGDDTVYFLRKKIDVGVKAKEFLDNGLVAKLRHVDEYDAEFCSSVFMPSSHGLVLVPKPGKLLAKTFWCKNLHYKWSMVEQQFAGVLRGLENSCAMVPGFRGLYNNGVYRKWFGRVEAMQDQYQEYAEEKVFATQETRTWVMVRYDLSSEELDELELELANSFPVRLTSPAAMKMIEKDWSDENNGEHLTECRASNSLISVILEECVRYVAPFSSSLLIGCLESILNNSWYNLIGHLVLMIVSVKFGFFPALVLHIAHNWLAGPKLCALRSFQLIFQTTMPSKSKKRAKNAPKPTKQRVQPRQSYLSVYSKMLADPCEATLVPGFYGDSSGILGRYKTVLRPQESEQNGYFLWAPNAVSLDPAIGASSIYFASTDLTNRPVNTNVNSFGRVAPTTTGVFSSTTGANQFVIGLTVADFRCVSACVRVTYIGATSACAGRIAYVDNISPATVLSANPATVGEIFSMSAKTNRLSLDTQEVTWRPNPETAALYRNNTAFIFQSVASSPTVINPTAATLNSTMFGFAWSGIPANQLVFEFIQNIEWRPESNTGYVSTVPKQMSEPMVGKVLAYLDRNFPEWSTSLMRAGHSALSGMVQAALAGSLPVPLSRGSRRLAIMR